MMGWETLLFMKSSQNRNWAYEYGGLGQSSSPCSDTYSGSGPASEVEVANVQG